MIRAGAGARAAAVHGIRAVATRRQESTRRLTGLLLSGLALLASGCAPGPERPSPAPAGAAPPLAGDLYRPGQAGVRVYAVRPQDSEVRILVYRSGPLAALGHNHVIASRDLEGFVRIEEQGGSGRADLSMPVATLSVDDPAMRAEAGPDFPLNVSPDAGEATRRNLLGPVVLDAARYPYVTVAASLSAGPAREAVLETLFRVRDATYRTRVPARLTVDGQRLEVEADLTLSQTDLGLTPFSALGGALTVEDALPVHVRLVAWRSSGGQASAPGYDDPLGQMAAVADESEVTR